MDVVRCKCPTDSAGTKCGRNAACAIHGDHSPVPLRAWILSHSDKDLLRSMRIAVLTADEIEELRKADEDRFRRD